MGGSDKLRILVVDDDPLMVKLISKHVTEIGYDVLCAHNGREATQILLRDGAEIVITDWNMPEMDGLELCKVIRDHEAIPFVYVIIMTAHTDDDRVLEAFAAGADDYLCKPFRSKEMLARLRAGERIINLQQNLDRRNREVHRYNAEMAVANRKLGEANDKLNTMATTDELTGLLNRREALHRLKETWASAVRRHEPLACIMIDIDHFKQFNDTHGHAAGDQVLRHTAEILSSVGRRGEDVCRLGGEEFLVLCPNSTEAMAAVCAERMRIAIETKPTTMDGSLLAVNVSAGVAERLADMKEPEELMRAADQALYAAKGQGRNRISLASSDTGEDCQEAPDQSTRDEQARQVGRSERLRGHAPRVLLVGDDATARQQLKDALPAFDFEVVAVKNRDDVEKQVDIHRPDVIVVEDDLRDTCGSQWRAREDAADIPILLIGSRDDEGRIATAYDGGVDSYLTRPFHPRELASRVQAMTRLHRGRQELMESNAVRGEQTRVMSLLLDYSRELAAADGLGDVLERSVAVAAELMCCRRVSIMLPDASSGELVVAKAIGMTEALAEGAPAAQDTHTAARVYATGSAVVANELSAEPPSSEHYHSRFYISMPLITQGSACSDRVIGVLNITDRYDGRPFQPQELEYFDLIANTAAASIGDWLTREARDQARDSIVIALATLAEYRDTDTGQHLERVMRFSMILARELRTQAPYATTITDEFMANLERSVPLHDIGKVAVPDHILQKPGRLTDDETTVMRTHAQIGAQTIHSVLERVPGADFLVMAEDIASSHHEWFDGGGYPRGLEGQAIPLAARIVAVADVYDALTTRRIYKQAVPHERAVQIIVESRGMQFDPDVVDVFRHCETEFHDLGLQLADKLHAGQFPDNADPTPLPPVPSVLSVGAPAS